MHLICSYCGKFIKDKEPIEVHKNTHGNCPDCFVPLLKQNNGLSYDEYLESFDIPVVILDHECRVSAANRAGLGLMEKPIDRVIGVLGGEALECRYSRLDEGCGKTNHCETCTIRNLIQETQEKKCSSYNQPITIDREEGLSNFLVSTIFDDGMVLIIFENS